MKKIICLLLVLVTVFVMTACSVTIPIGATGNNLGTKVGEAGASFLGLIPVKVEKDGDNDKLVLNVDDDGNLVTAYDYSIATAAKNGGITKISTVQLKIEQILAYFTITTIVTGE